MRTVRWRRSTRTLSASPRVTSVDDAEPPVTADCAVEHVRVPEGAGLDPPAVSQDDLQRPDRRDQRPRTDVAAVRVDRQRSAHGEAGVALHVRNRQARWIDVLLDLSPARPSLHTDGPRPRVELEDAVEAPHVDVERTLGRNLAAHTVAGTADRDRARVVRDGLDNLLVVVGVSTSATRTGLRREMSLTMPGRSTAGSGWRTTASELRMSAPAASVRISAQSVRARCLTRSPESLDATVTCRHARQVRATLAARRC